MAAAALTIAGAAFTLGAASTRPLAVMGRVVGSSGDSRSKTVAMDRDAAPSSQAPRGTRASAAWLEVGASRADAGRERVLESGAGEAAVALRAIERLREQVEIAAGSPGARGQPLEARAVSMNLYLDGWVDAVLAVRGADDRSVSEAVENALCESSAEQDELVALVRVAGRVPGGATERGIDCALARVSGEGYLLWETLDTWNSGRLPATPGVESWRARATDPRTIRRLSPLGAVGRREP